MNLVTSKQKVTLYQVGDLPEGNLTICSQFFEDAYSNRSCLQGHPSITFSMPWTVHSARLRVVMIHSTMGYILIHCPAASTVRRLIAVHVRSEDVYRMLAT